MQLFDIPRLARQDRFSLQLKHESFDTAQLNAALAKLLQSFNYDWSTQKLHANVICDIDLSVAGMLLKMPSRGFDISISALSENGDSGFPFNLKNFQLDNFTVSFDFDSFDVAVLHVQFGLVKGYKP